MKVCIVQPPYSTDYSRSEELFQWEMQALDRCDTSMDLIVFPESSSVPAMARSKEDVVHSYERFFQKLFDKACETARRCDAVVFFNAHDKREKGLYNTTFAIDRTGTLVGTYDKAHLTPGEVSTYGMVHDYSYEYTPPQVIEIDGLRYCFLTCYDFYFYEIYPVIARQRPDIIIGCSHQRSDTHSALEIINRFCAYNCNAYVVRASVSMGEDAPLGGCSCVVAPNGEMLVDMKSRTGMEIVDIDPKKKYYKPAGFGNPPAAHHEYTESGRRPWKYRPAGPSVITHDRWLGYPRVCAYHGFSTVAPENSMPAFGAAIAAGAEEIAFDLWWTKDGEIVSAYDERLEQVSNGNGFICDYTLAELQALDFGSKFGEAYTGMKIPTFEEILKKFTCQVVMNIHLRTRHVDEKYDCAILSKIIALIDQYDCRKWVYFTSGNDNVLELCREMAPDITRCAGAGKDPWNMVDRAITYECKKIQLVKPYFNQETVDRAHAHGIICNVCWSDDPQETKKLLNMGIDVVLTNDYQRISQIVDTVSNATCCRDNDE